MTKKKRRIDATTKARVALEAIREQRTSSEIASAHNIHTSQVAKWKRQAIDGMTSLFTSKNAQQQSADNVAELYEQIGRLKMELEWLKKKSGDLS